MFFFLSGIIWCFKIVLFFCFVNCFVLANHELIEPKKRRCQFSEKKEEKNKKKENDLVISGGREVNDCFLNLILLHSSISQLKMVILRSEREKKERCEEKGGDAIRTNLKKK